MPSRARELHRLARQGKATAPVFIVGDARSGTTLLYRLIQQQPAFGPSPLALQESSFARNLIEGSDVSGPGRRIGEFLGAPETWLEYRRIAGPALRRRDLVHRVAPQALTHEHLAWVGGLGLLARAYIGLATEARGVTRLVEKTPHHTPFSGHLRRWFPQGHQLHLIRHPLDVLSSYWRRRQAEPASAYWTDITSEAFVDRYAAVTDLALQAEADHPAVFRTIRYEALVAEPVATMATVFAHLGAPFSVDHLVPIERAERFGADERHDPHLFGELEVRTKSWQDFVEPDVAREVERRLAPTMARLGYESRTVT